MGEILKEDRAGESQQSLGANRCPADVGEVNWLEAVVHSAKNVGKTEQHVIRNELKF